MTAELVPAALGGRLEDVPGLVRALKPVFRRDLALGFDMFAPFMAATSVWMAGSERQRRHVADTLLRGDRACVIGLDDDLRGTFAGPRLVLTGEARSIGDVASAAVLVLFIQTDQGRSTILLDAQDLDPVCPSGTLKLDGEFPVDCLVGQPGQGTSMASQTLAITRTALPALALGALDTALRTTLEFARDRRLYGTTVSELPHARATLAGVFVDLLACDALTTVALRFLRHTPAATGVLAAAASHLIQRIVEDALYELSIVLGARSFLSEGEHAIFEKIVRDVPLLRLAYGRGDSRATRDATLQAATACATVRGEERDGFLAGSAWVFAAHERLAARRAGTRCVLAPELDEELFRELVRRHDEDRHFDLGGAR